MIEHLTNYFLFYGVGIIVILTWIVETNWFWIMIGLSKKKSIKSTKRTTWYGERRHY